VRRFEPDLAILVGADIAPAGFLRIPRIGTINAHYGLLPA
jgi:methionyl-tRNA formyltransferase